jgi:undecaprenyl diphosphate synthase
MVLTLALSYGGQEEIIDAARALARAVQQGEISPDEITEEPPCRPRSPRCAMAPPT